MPVPTRPVAGAAIATSWGTDVHDRVFAPKGCKVAGAATTIPVTGAVVTLDLASATDDPGGWLNATTNLITVPTGAEGLYLVSFQVTCDNGSAASTTQVSMYRNTSTLVMQGTTDNEGSVDIVVSNSTVLVLVATDTLILKARQLHVAGSNYTGTVTSLIALRIGDDWGA